tara:strand:- start:7 stop:615 length:609 start_codon:yes stop_codon:yes gene_type:complete
MNRSRYNTPYISIFNNNYKPIHTTYKSFSNQKPHIYGAGILPFQIHADNEIYFLLGQDKEGTWSDFGGRVELKDIDMEETAIREFYEETMGTVLDLDTLNSYMKNSCNYIKTNSKTLNGSPYYMYLIRIPYSNYRDNFKKNYKFLKYINVEDKYLEKIDIRWISRDTLINSLESNDCLELRRVFKTTINKNIDTIMNVHQRL